VISGFMAKPAIIAKLPELLGAYDASAASRADK
jgi:hypothetical protein